MELLNCSNLNQYFSFRCRRNLNRFSVDCTFQFREDEFNALMSQFATSNDGAATSGRGGRRKLPLVFTEHGALQGGIRAQQFSRRSLP
jgi:hypothetical protein